MMHEGLEALAGKEYPGRGIVMGLSSDGTPTVAYFITGRRPSSRARKIVADEQRFRSELSLRVRGLNAEDEQKASRPDLIFYPAILVYPGAISVSNGAQTSGVAAEARDGTPTRALDRAHTRWSYEDDPPIYTSRISGVLTRRNGSVSGALGIIRRAPETSFPLRTVYRVPFAVGEGRLLSTYTGQNLPTPPAFEGEPQRVRIPWVSAHDIAQVFYDALAPHQGKDDLRVSVAVVQFTRDGLPSYFIKNSHA